MPENQSQSFDSWAIVELFGHNVIAGRVSEQTIGGASFVRVDVPEIDDQPEFTKFFGGAAIYAITPTGEAEVRAACERLRVRPVKPYVIPDLSLPSPKDDGDDWEGF
jgi:hypothetical protein